MGNNRDQDSTSPIEEGSTEFSNLSDSISEYEPVSVPSEINRINRLQNQFRIDNNRNPRNEDIMSDSSATSSPPPPPPPPPIRPHQNPCPNGSNNISYDNIAAYAQSIVGIIRSTLAGIPNPQGVDDNDYIDGVLDNSKREPGHWRTRNNTLNNDIEKYLGDIETNIAKCARASQNRYLVSAIHERAILRKANHSVSQKRSKIKRRDDRKLKVQRMRERGTYKPIEQIENPQNVLNQWD